MALALVVCALTMSGCNEAREAYRLRIANHVRDELARIPNVKVIDVGGYFDDGLLLEDIYAEVEIANRGPLHLVGLNEASFQQGGSFGISRVGDWTPAVNRKGKKRRPDVLECGPAGEAATLLPAAVGSVQDAIERYDEIAATVAQWPEYPRTSTVSDSEGDIVYSRKRLGEHPVLILQKRH